MAQLTRRYYVDHYSELEKLAGSTRTMILLCLLYNLLSSATMEVTSNHETACVCPGDHVIYMCTVYGMTGVTIWNGTAFIDCSQHEITLHHSKFMSNRAPIGTCNEGDIVGRGLRAEGNNYSSQLNVTITPDIVGKTIICAYDAFTADSSNDMIVFSTVVPGQFPPPKNVHISNANFILQVLKFTWSPVAPECPDIHYNILASNCGSCPTTTNHTTVTCTNVPTDNDICSFSVQTVLCGNLVGQSSDPVNVTTTTAKIIIKDSLYTIIPGGVMLLMGVVLIIGCLLFGLIKQSKLWSQ